MPVIQFEARIAPRGEPSDLDGDIVSKQESMEFMQGAGVRILIDPKSSPDKVGRMLEKILDWIAQEGFDPPYKKYGSLRSLGS